MTTRSRRLDPEPRRRPVRVGQHDAAARHERLPPVLLGHREPAPAEPCANRRQNPGVLLERKVQDAGHHFPRQVVFGGSQSAGRDDEVGAAQRVTNDAREIVAIVADDGLPADVDAELVQPACEKQRIRVEAVRREQLGADGDDLGRSHSGHHGVPDRSLTPICMRMLP